MENDGFVGGNSNIFWIFTPTKKKLGEMIQFE